MKIFFRFAAGFLKHCVQFYEKWNKMFKILYLRFHPQSELFTIFLECDRVGSVMLIFSIGPFSKVKKWLSLPQIYHRGALNYVARGSQIKIQ